MTALGRLLGALGSLLHRSWAHLGALGWSLDALWALSGRFGDILGPLWGAFAVTFSWLRRPSGRSWNCFTQSHRLSDSPTLTVSKSRDLIFSCSYNLILSCVQALPHVSIFYFMNQLLTNICLLASSLSSPSSSPPSLQASNWPRRDARSVNN